MVDINFGHTQSMQRELQAQQDFSVAEIFGGKRGMKSEPRKLVSLARMAGEGAQAKKHSHPEFSGRQLRLDGYWRDGSTGVTTLKRVAISYNMEDDTMSVKVLADKKRGLTEMTILKNHLVPNPLVSSPRIQRNVFLFRAVFGRQGTNIRGVIWAQGAMSIYLAATFILCRQTKQAG